MGKEVALSTNIVSGSVSSEHCTEAVSSSTALDALPLD